MAPAPRSISIGNLELEPHLVGGVFDVPLLPLVEVVGLELEGVSAKVVADAASDRVAIGQGGAVFDPAGLAVARRELQGDARDDVAGLCEPSQTIAGRLQGAGTVLPMGSTISALP